MSRCTMCTESGGRHFEWLMWVSELCVIIVYTTLLLLACIPLNIINKIDDTLKNAIYKIECTDLINVMLVKQKGN